VPATQFRAGRLDAWGYPVWPVGLRLFAFLARAREEEYIDRMLCGHLFNADRPV
jgi:hypothetical protein